MILACWGPARCRNEDGRPGTAVLVIVVVIVAVIVAADNA